MLTSFQYCSSLGYKDKTNKQKKNFIKIIMAVLMKYMIYIYLHTLILTSTSKLLYTTIKSLTFTFKIRIKCDRIKSNRL